MDSTSSNSSSGSDATANRIALAAAVLAAGAFIVAFLQALLEYFSSSESRNKCTYQAIGVSSKHAKFLGWHWRIWKLRVRYPLLRLECTPLLALRRQFFLKAIDSPKSPLRPIIKTHNWGWRSIEERDNLSFSSVADSYTKAVEGDDTVTTKKLSWAECWILWWWKLRNRSRPIIRPRASWAQLIIALGISDTSSLEYKHADADLIPGSVDVPIQRVRLFELGYLAFTLGFKHVKIKLSERTFEAVGEFGTISTIFQSDLGKVLRFEGDMLAIHSQISKGHPLNLINNYVMVNGKLQLGPGFAANGFFYPLHLLPVAIRNGWTQEIFDRKLREFIVSSLSNDSTPRLPKGEVAAEAVLFGEIFEQKSETIDRAAIRTPTPSEKPDEVLSFEPRAMSRTSTGLSAKDFGALISAKSGTETAALETASVTWQGATALNIPTILATTAFALLSPVELGFPSRLLIDSLLPWFKWLASTILRRSRGDMHISTFLLCKLRQNRLDFHRSSDPFWYTYNEAGQSSNCTYGWIYKDTKEVYDSCQKEIQDELILREADGNYTGDVRAVLIPDAAALLENFDPKSWAAKMESFVALSIVAFRPTNLLWVQIVLLDVGIHFLVRKGWYEGHDEGFNLWSPENLAVIRAVVQSWDSNHQDTTTATTATTANGPLQPQGARTSTSTHTEDLCGTHQSLADSEPKPHEEAEVPNDVSEPAEPPTASSKPAGSHLDWNLLSCLERQPELKLSDDPDIQTRRIRQLSNLLQLRALFYVALLLLIPDSSDFFLAEKSQVEMPMI